MAKSTFGKLDEILEQVTKGSENRSENAMDHEKILEAALTELEQIQNQLPKLSTSIFSLFSLSDEDKTKNRLEIARELNEKAKKEMESIRKQMGDGPQHSFSFSKELNDRIKKVSMERQLGEELKKIFEDQMNHGPSQRK